jgi:hypothetical protein
MPRPTRLSLLLIPLTIAVLTQALPGRAQQAPSVRFAFADTTLLRDTLGLRFDRLFPVADSLQLPPDTLRALMVRFRLTMPRMLHLADSLSVTVDSVGAFMDRQKLNPLAGGNAQRTQNTFNYTSGYDIQKTSTTWTNGSTYKLFHGPLYLTNGTNIELQRILSGGSVSLRQNREATTEGGLTVNKGLSFGARSYQLRVFSADPGSSTTTDDEKKSEYGVTSRALTTSRHLNTELNLRSGYLDDRSAIAIKRGASGSADARVRYANAGVLTHDLSGSVTGNVSHTRPPGGALELNTNDLATNLRGNLVLLPNSPVRLNVNYGLRNSRVETPLENGKINRLLQASNTADGTMRLRRDNDHYVDLNGSLNRSSSYTGRHNDAGGRATARWTLLGGALDGNYDESRETTFYPAGYDEHGLSRSSDATLARNFGPMFIGRIVASIGLDQLRYVTRAAGATPPSARDAYRQSMRTELNYAPPSQKLSSRLAGQVSLNRSINIAAATTASNTDTRSYRGEWSWSYRLLRSLTVTQNNQIQADYQQYPFAPERNSLSLSYNTSTSLSAALPGNLSIDVGHNVSQAPRGSYTRQPDGFDALLLSDETRNRGLNASLRFAPFPGVSLHVDPRYSDAERSGTVNGIQARQRTDLRLDVAGGVDINLHVGSRGMLTGRLNRSYIDQRTINYENGLPAPTPRSEDDYWNGSLQLTWSL